MRITHALALLCFTIAYAAALRPLVRKSSLSWKVQCVAKGVNANKIRSGRDLSLFSSNSNKDSNSNSSSNTNSGEGIASPKQELVVFPVVETGSQESVPLKARIQSLMSGNGWNLKNLDRHAISKLGLNALLAYGFVSNFTYITIFIISWVTHGKRTGLSPLAEGQWQSFLLVYTGLWAANNILRPLRFSLSLLISPIFEKFVDIVQRRTGLKKTIATGIVVFLVNVLGTISYLAFGLLAATSMAGVPLFA